MQIKRTPLFALVILLTATVSVRADKVDDYIKAEMEKQHVPGISLAVIKDGKIIKISGYGLANVELNTPAEPDTVYKIGSVSKQFIAAGIMLLIQEVRISLDDNISKFLDGTPDTWKGITVRHLLTHTGCRRMRSTSSPKGVIAAKHLASSKMKRVKSHIWWFRLRVGR